MDTELAKLKSLYIKLAGVFPTGSSVLTELSDVISGLSNFRNKNRITSTGRNILTNSYTPEDVIFICANVFGCSIDEIKGRVRKERMVRARRLVAYILHVRLGLTLTFSGDFINKDHSTVLYSCRIVTKLIENKFDRKKSLKSKLDFIEKAKNVLERLEEKSNKK